MKTLTAKPETGCKCPICSGLSQPLFKKYGYLIWGCGSCGHQFINKFLNPEHIHHVYGDDYFQGGEAGYPDYLAESKLLNNHGRRYARMLRRHMPPGKVLDVGAAAGFVLQGLVDYGWQGYGIEPNDRMAAYGRAQGLLIKTGSLEQLQSQQQFDLITMIQVIPHFFELHQALQTANTLTKPGGYWLIETWNRSSWTARMLRHHWHEYSPPSVLHWFSPDGVLQLVNQYGFDEVARGRPQKWINAAHGKSLLSYKFKDMGVIGALGQQLMRLIPNELALPYPAEDLFWVLVRKRSLSRV